MKLSIIIPIYNEYHNIDAVIERIKAVTPDLAVSEIEMILVDDGSIDGTSDKLEKYKNKSNIIIHKSSKNLGKGAATRMGLNYVSGDIVLIQDADLEYDPRDYSKLILPMLNGEADIVYGSRFLNRKGRPQGMAFINWLMNIVLRVMVNALYGANLSDEATAYKMFKTNILKNIDLKSNGFEFCPEVTAKVLKKNYSIKEVPISYKGRTVEEGKKIRWHDGIKAIWTLLKYRFIA